MRPIIADMRPAFLNLESMDPFFFFGAPPKATAFFGEPPPSAASADAFFVGDTSASDCDSALCSDCDVAGRGSSAAAASAAAAGGASWTMPVVAMTAMTDLRARTLAW